MRIINIATYQYLIVCAKIPYHLPIVTAETQDFGARPAKGG